MLRRIFKWAATLVLVGAGTASAVVPLQMNVQGSLLNNDGNPVNGTFTITFTLYSGQGAGATTVWTETIADVAASGGVFDEVLGGAATPLSAATFTANSQLWLGVKIVAGPGVPNGGQAELPRRPLTSVAYAMESQNAVSAASADNVTCTDCVSLSELGFDVATQAELDTALSQPATSALDLQCTACVATTELNFDVATQAELDSAVSTINSAISGVTGNVSTLTTTVNGINTTVGTLSTTVGGLSTTVGGLNTTVGALSTTVGGLSTTVGGHGTDISQLKADVATLKTDVTGLKAEVTLSDLGCTAGQVAVVGAGGAWGCQAAPVGAPTTACQGDQKALQWDGSAWKCVTLNQTGLSTGNAKGFEARDSWGFVWDGIERQSGTWAEANTACTNRGGRLPTITELWRVSGGQFSEIGTSYEANFLWSRTQWDRDQHTRLRITDGSIDGLADSSKSAYRCVWPNNSLTYFAGNKCYGPAGSECHANKVESGKMNIDEFDRPPVPYLAALDECAFYGAHLVGQRDYAENIPVIGGLPNGTNNWLWTSEQNLYYCNQTVRWTGVDPAYHDSVEAPQYTTYHDTRTSQGNRLRFRCIGIGYDSGSHPNTVGDVTNAEFVAPTVKLKSTLSNKGSTNIWSAISDCYSAGGHLPTQRDYTELIRSGLPNGAGSGTYVWNSDWTRQDYTNGIRWTGTDTGFTGYHDAHVTWFYVGLEASYNMPYRCVFYPIDTTYGGPPKSTTCDGSGNFSCCNTDQFKCFNVEKGGTTKIKVWADPVDRGSVNYINAIKQCQSEGGRLPNTREMTELIRNGLPNGNGADYLWTSDSVIHPNNSSHDYAHTVRWSNVDVTWTPTTENSNVSYQYKHPTSTSYRNKFRCIWTNELR